MNLPKYPAKEPFPGLDNIQSLIREANSFEIDEFNKEAFKLTGQWCKNVDEYIQSAGNIKQEVFLKLWQANDEPIANNVVIMTDNLEIISMNDEATKIKTTTITDIGMTSFGETVGLVFITDGDLSDDTNEALFIPKPLTGVLRVSSHLFITN